MSGRVLFEQLHRGHLWRLEISTHKGRTFGNWRKWYSIDGEWKPSRDGCSIPLENLPALTASLLAYHGLEPPEGLQTAS